VIIAVADHFEPAILPGQGSRPAPRDVQEQRLERWCREYPLAVDRWRDSDGQPFKHTYFYPAEQYDDDLIARLSEHCRAGWGELEVQLHHGVDEPDSASNTRSVLCDFRDALARHRCLARWDGSGAMRYAFVHGNWALANSAGGRFCGVDSEMQILSDTGCYADMTLPSAPDPTQVSKINAIYECGLPLTRRAPHRRGRDLHVGRPPRVFPILVQGPLMLSRRKGHWGLPRPVIENGEISSRNPPDLRRLRLWRQARVGVHGRPDWLFVKLHCHGMDPRDESAMLGPGLQGFLEAVVELARNTPLRLHFVTAREMVNMILAACDGRDGDPDQYRGYRLRPLGE
jgi:hypothetical protein